MKDSTFILNECHLMTVNSFEQSIHGIVTTWLTKELHK